MSLTPEFQNQLLSRSQEVSSTKRNSSEGLEKLLFHPHDILDHGFVVAVDYMGTDSSIVHSARLSYGAGTKTVLQDRGLIRYLMRHLHTSPFEMCEIKLHLKLPVFVARQWLRHRMANVNEYSARYSILSNEFYIPELQNIARQSLTNNQGRGEVLDPEVAQIVQHGIQAHSEEAYKLYELLLAEDDPEADERAGYEVARELGRMVLPTNVYTEFHWKIDLHNLLHFLRLRDDPHAQYEIRVYAEKIMEIVHAWVPMAAEAFLDYRKNNVNFSAQEFEIIRLMLSGEEPNYDKLSKGEVREFKLRLGLE